MSADDVNDPIAEAADTAETPSEDGVPLDEPDASPEEQIAELHEHLARARADYANLQKRVARDAALERERVKARVLEHFLQVFEYGRMAEAEAEKQPGPLAEGVKMIVREFERLLESEGVKTVGAAGDAFDGNLHEAVGEEASDGIAAGAISRVVSPGYLLGERVLRYARVMVAPRAADAADASDAADA